MAALLLFQAVFILAYAVLGLAEPTIGESKGVKDIVSSMKASKSELDPDVDYDLVTRLLDNVSFGAEPRGLLKKKKDAKNVKTKGKGKGKVKGKGKPAAPVAPKNVKAKKGKKKTPVPAKPKGKATVSKDVMFDAHPSYVRYKATISDPKHFYQSQVHYDSKSSGDDTVYLYFKKPLSPAEMKKLLRKSRVQFKDKKYVAMDAKDLAKLGSTDSKNSWVYDDTSEKFYNVKQLRYKNEKESKGDDDVSSDMAKDSKDVSSVESSVSEKSSSEEDGTKDGSPDSGDGTGEGGSKKSDETDSTTETSSESSDSKDSTEESVAGTSENAEKSSETKESKSDNESVDESHKTTEKESEKADSDEDTSTSDSYSVVDAANGESKSEKHEDAIEGAIASDSTEDGTPILKSYKKLDEDRETEATSEDSSKTGGKQRKQAPVWSLRRIQNEVVSTKKKVKKLENKLGETNNRLDKVVRI
ncbi:uncharacterized protein BXIN_0180 [Babesia sp. Xinjiang]|uniref:uncharacterized protein n=1 Tax=Babesia sp. Xinjiang TaxID=462227 RepID=UPI000A23AA4D|nr:uncharacterized protein BXIN_0180 [Babesia sp. Xinjiang]ORM39854.1 hypothetical protein BXIN_0180 [Babesia sp. Xinjiang]